MAFHFLADRVIRHWVERELVHEITQMVATDAADSITIALWDLFRLQDVVPFVAPESKLTPAALAAARATEDETEQRRIMTEAGIDELTRDIFLRDFREAQFEGSVLRIDFRLGEDGYSDYGMLLFRGPERLWILRIEPGPGSEQAEMTIMPGDLDVFAREVRLLVDRSTT